MDLLSPSGYFAKRIKLFDGTVSPLMSFPFKASLNQRKKRSVVEYEQIGSSNKRLEVLEYPSDPSKPAYATIEDPNVLNHLTR